jgi:hypothetical protein
MTFIPPKSQVGNLDPAIAGEGQKVSGDISWTPPPPAPVIPDISQVKSIRHYFGRSNFPVWPAWLYHPTEDPRLVNNADEAGKLGVTYRKASDEEKGRYGRDWVWDWMPTTQWRPYPLQSRKFDPANPGQGKNYVRPTLDPMIEQNKLLTQLLPGLADVIAQGLAKALQQAGNAPAASLDPRTLAADAVSSGAKAMLDQTAEQPNALAEAAQWDALLQEAEARGIRVDKRWSVKTLQEHIELHDERRPG